MKPSWGRGWSVGLRIWVERAGQAILGKGRLELLEAIDRWHSISAAARHMRMSYRRAWKLVQSINAAAGEPLVTAATGGTQGGGAQLTPLGRWAIGVFREVQQQVQLSAAATLPQLVQHTGAAVLHVAAAASLEEVLRELLVGYALQEPTVRVQTVFGPSDELAAHLLAGAPADLFLTADTRQLDRLAEAGLLVAGSPTLLARGTLAVITQSGRDLPLLRPSHLKRPVVGRIALARPDSPTGYYTKEYLQSVQLFDSMSQRALWCDNSRAVVVAIRTRQADVGVIYASDAFRAEGCRVLFEIHRLPVPVAFTGALLQRGRDVGPARQLLDYLSARAAASCFLRCGFLPVRR
jgi:molybdate transport system substrate-binding protein